MARGGFLANSVQREIHKINGAPQRGAKDKDITGKFSLKDEGLGQAKASL